MIVTGIILMRKREPSGAKVVSAILSISVPVNDFLITSGGASCRVGRPCQRKWHIHIGFL
jgi:hypothetical protein